MKILKILGTFVIASCIFSPTLSFAQEPNKGIQVKAVEDNWLNRAIASKVK